MLFTAQQIQVGWTSTEAQAELEGPRGGFLESTINSELKINVLAEC